MKNVTKILMALSATACGISFAQDKGDFAIPFSDPSKTGALYVDIKTGSVTIKGSARKDVSVQYIRENDSDNDRDHDHGKEKNSKDGLRRIGGGSLDIEASEYQNTVTIISNNWSEGVELVIEVPSTISIKAKAYNDGDLEVSNITGDLELTNYNGGITALAISGSAIAQTYNGDIKIVYDKLKPDTPLSYANYNGDIDITFPASLKATLKLKTKQGEIYTGFDGSVVRSNPVQKSDSKSGAFKVVIDDWVKSEVNGGGPEITMKSYNGDIYVRKK
jgi:Putative adhesin